MLDIVQNYINSLTTENKPSIKIIVDETIPTHAKLELAEVYNRDYHVIRHNNSVYVNHLIMHELTHLDFIYSARALNNNYFFTSTDLQKKMFINDHKKMINKLNKFNIGIHQINEFFDIIFIGINTQMYNCPIDLFIEDKLYQEYENLRKIQALSIENIIETGIEATRKQRSLDIIPSNLFSISKILNIISALQYRDLFGHDYIPKFSADKNEMSTAESLYNEYLEYKNDRASGEEYEIIQNWGKDLKLDRYFTLRKDINK